MDNTATFIGVGSNGAVNPGAQQPCIFPLLKLDVILKCMSEMDMDMTQEELEDPAHHKEKLRKVFAMMVRKNLFWNRSLVFCPVVWSLNGRCAYTLYILDA